MVYAGCVVVVVMERVGVVVVRRACGWMQGIWSPKLKQVSTEKWKKKIHGAPGSLPCCPPSLSPLDLLFQQSLLRVSRCRRCGCSWKPTVCSSLFYFHHSIQIKATKNTTS